VGRGCRLLLPRKGRGEGEEEEEEEEERTIEEEAGSQSGPAEQRGHMRRSAGSIVGGRGARVGRQNVLQAKCAAEAVLTTRRVGPPGTLI